MPDIYDELARATGWERRWSRLGMRWLNKTLPATERIRTTHPYATIDAIDAEFRRRGWVWTAGPEAMCGVMGPFLMIETRTDDTRHDLAALLLRCIEQSESSQNPAP